jgi:hypothetical protein
MNPEVRKILDGLSPSEQKLLQTRLNRVLIRRKAIATFPTPAHLAQRVRPDEYQTAMLDKLDEVVIHSWERLWTRWVINTPPQEGKTSRLSQIAPVWLLLQDPTLRIGIASYEQGIAAQSTLAARQIIEVHGSGYKGQKRDPDHEDILGLTLDPDRAMATNWALTDIPGRQRAGGMLAAGIGSALTGRPLDVLIIDDPLKDAAQADSHIYRQRVKDWYQAVATTRLSGRSIIIVIQTRWHEDDLSGWLLAEDATRVTRQWKQINIPAQAGPEDPLGRAPGDWLVSARGRSAEEWENKRINAGTRWWHALYQGEPSAPEGGTFKRAWFDHSRVAAAPPLRRVLTFVDPADNTGSGDEAGIITAGAGHDGDFYVLEDNSGHYTVAQWIRQAIFAMVRHGSSALAYEQSLSGLRRAIKQEWKTILLQAQELHRQQELWSRFGEDWPTEHNEVAVFEAIKVLSTSLDTDLETFELEHALEQLWPHVPQLLEFPVTGPPVDRVRPMKSKQLRAEFISPLYESGRVHHVGHMPRLEQQMATWMPSQDSPDRMDADVHVLTELSKSSGGTHDRPRSGPHGRNTIDTQVARSAQRGGMAIRTRP